MLQGKKIIIGISGGIAAYKIPILIRLFIKANAQVKVICTKNAMEFVTKTTLETLSKNSIYLNTFSEANEYSTEHISISDWGDIFIVAPATANIIGKYANGIADDALSTSLLAFNKKVVIAPSMNCKMWENKSLINNINILKQQNVKFIDPTEGNLACNYDGKGRMEEPEKIFAVVQKLFESEEKLINKKVLITAGPTQEAIDPVRYISNHSSGIMGYSLALEAANNGAEVTLVSGPVNIELSHPNIKIIKIISADEMFKVCNDVFPNIDIAIMSAAVADYKPINKANTKIKKTTKNASLSLIKNIDILDSLGKIKTKNQILIGFALEDTNEISNAQIKLNNKNLDFIVLNSLNDEGAGFKTLTNKITIIDKKNNVYKFPTKPKSEVAIDIINKITELIKK